MNHRVVSIGECMVELSPARDDLFRLGFSGDTFNTAWYLRRQLPPDWSVGYLTCVGDDPISDRMTAFISGAGIETGSVRRVAGRTVGLYLIELTDGERSFIYWRGESAARELAEDGDWLAARLVGAGLAYFSGITAAILPAEGRATLLDALGSARRDGVSVVFDPNLRPRLWPDVGAMRRGIEAAAAVADIVMPSFEDEATHFGDADPDATIARYRDLGARTVVVKNGPGEMRAWDVDDGSARSTPGRVEIVDTTAAGDSFNAGFLAARLDGLSLGEALDRGARLAGAVVQARGALVTAGTARAG